MTTLQQQARALGDPTRHEIFRYLVDAERPVDIAELTDHLGLNHNAIRQHLSKLVAAELAVEAKAATGARGRPRLCYTTAPAVESRWGVTGPYERLALMLSEIIRTGDSAVEVGRRAGRRRRLGSPDVVDPVADLVEQMARHGLDPTLRQTDRGADITLHTCPFVSAAMADPDTVCGLHLGIAQGLAESAGGLVIDELVPKDPRRAQCRLHCHTESVGHIEETGTR
jgi:predicted ArsR family transcriptional regulator